MSDQGDDDHEDDDPEPVKIHPLHDFLKENTGENTEIKRESSEYMQLQLENVARTLIEAAEDKAEEDNKTRINQQHVEAAFEDVFGAYRVIDRAVTTMGEYQSELKRIGSETHVLEFDTEEDAEE